MELRVADVVCSLLHGDVIGIVQGQSLCESLELDIDVSLLVVLGYQDILLILSLQQHSEYCEKIGEDGDLLDR